jgi:uncharacterized protein YqiB (DUF1249 family)
LLGNIKEMKELEKLTMALYKNNNNLQRFLPPKKSPRYSLDRRRGGHQNRLDIVEKRNILLLPAIQSRLSSP